MVLYPHNCTYERRRYLDRDPNCLNRPPGLSYTVGLRLPLHCTKRQALPEQQWSVELPLSYLSESGSQSWLALPLAAASNGPPHPGQLRTQSSTDMKSWTSIRTTVRHLRRV